MKNLLIISAFLFANMGVHASSLLTHDASEISVKAPTSQSQNSAEPSSNIDRIHQLIDYLFHRDFRVSWENPQNITQGVHLKVRAIEENINKNNLDDAQEDKWISYHLSKKFLNKIRDDKYLLYLPLEIDISYRQTSLCGFKFDGVARVDVYLPKQGQQQTELIQTYNIVLEDLEKYISSSPEQIRVFPDCSK